MNNNTRKLILLSLLGIVAVTVLLVGLYFFSRGYLEFSIKDEVLESNQGSLIIRNLDTNEVTEDKQVGVPTSAKSLLKTGLYEAEFSNGREISKYQFTIKRFSTTTLHISSQPQAATMKIGSQSNGCNFMVNNVLYSYKCTGYNPVYRHNPITETKFSSKVAVNSSAYSMITPYKNGFLGILNEGDEEVAPTLYYYDVVSNTSKKVAISGGIFNISIDRQGEGDRFLVANENGVYSFKDLTDERPVLLELGNDSFQQNYDTSISAYNGVVWVYMGLRSYGPDSEEEEKVQKSFKGGYLYKIDEQSGKTQETIRLPQKLRAIEARPAGDSMVFIDDRNFEIFRINGDTLGERTAAGGLITNFTDMGNGTFIYTQDNKVFQFDTRNRSQMLKFESSHMNISSINYSNNTLLMSTFIANDPSRLAHVYKLQLDKQALFPRKEWSLPVSYNDSNISSMDYNDELRAAIVLLKLESLAISRDQGPSADKFEVDYKTKQARDMLINAGINPDTYTISIRPY